MLRNKSIFQISTPICLSSISILTYLLTYPRTWEHFLIVKPWSRDSDEFNNLREHWTWKRSMNEKVFQWWEKKFLSQDFDRFTCFQHPWTWKVISVQPSVSRCVCVCVRMNICDIYIFIPSFIHIWTRALLARLNGWTDLSKISYLMSAPKESKKKHFGHTSEAWQRQMTPITHSGTRPKD
jgi:hypothetical protein